MTFGRVIRKKKKAAGEREGNDTFMGIRRREKREKKRKRKLVSRSVDVGPRVLTMNSFLPRWPGEGGYEEKKKRDKKRACDLERAVRER